MYTITRVIRQEPVMASAITVTSFVALIAFLASYQHQYELVIHHHQPHWVGSLYPLSVDLLIVATTLALWYAASRKWKRPLGVWAVFILAVAASAIANRADDPSPWGDIGAYISMWPAVAFLGAYETIVWMIRKERRTESPVIAVPEIRPNGHVHHFPPGAPGSLGTCTTCGRVDKRPGQGVKSKT